jgi:DNA-binding CsgD family transcriptional regulator
MGYKKAAGIKVEKRGPGRQVEGRPKKGELQRLYVKESKSIREIAEIRGCSKDRIYRALEEYGIRRRPHTRKSVLSDYGIGELRKLVEERGYRKTGEELGISGQGCFPSAKFGQMRSFLKLQIMCNNLKRGGMPPMPSRI